MGSSRCCGLLSVELAWETKSAHAVPKSAPAEPLAIAHYSITMASLLFASFANLTQVLFVQPPILDEYDGLEYSWKIFVFRPARKLPIHPCIALGS